MRCMVVAQICYTNTNASVAQGIEHRSPKAGVVRSNRTGGTREIAGQTV